MTENPNEVESVAELARQAASTELLAPGAVYAVPGKDGEIKVVNTDDLAEHPRHTRAVRRARDAASFNAYVHKHGLAGRTEVWADSVSSSIVAVLDAHGGEGKEPGWEFHKVSLDLELTKSWIAWMARDGGTSDNGWWDDQEEFAEFIETRALDVEVPDAATLMEIILSIQASSNHSFESSRRLPDGQIQFSYKEEIGGSAGTRGNLEIPKTIGLILQPYVGGPRVRVAARFRYRINGGNLRLGYVLERPQEVLDTAFVDIVTLIRNGKTHEDDGKPTFEGLADKYPVLHGRPA